MALKTLGYDVCMDDIIIDKINLKGYIKHDVDERLYDKPDALFHEMIIAYAGIIAKMQTEELLKKENALLHQTITELEEWYLI